MLDLVHWLVNAASGMSKFSFWKAIKTYLSHGPEVKHPLSYWLAGHYTLPCSMHLGWNFVRKCQKHSQV